MIGGQKTRSQNPKSTNYETTTYNIKHPRYGLMEQLIQDQAPSQFSKISQVSLTKKIQLTPIFLQKLQPNQIPSNVNIIRQRVIFVFSYRTTKTSKEQKKEGGIRHLQAGAKEERENTTRAWTLLGCDAWPLLTTKNGENKTRFSKLSTMESVCEKNRNKNGRIINISEFILTRTHKTLETDSTSTSRSTS